MRRGESGQVHPYGPTGPDHTGPMDLAIVHDDLTRVRVDAVVNAANSSLLGGGGVDGALHRVGGPEILADCRRLRETVLPQGLPVGQAVATRAGALPARWVVHTVGPVHDAGVDGRHLLRECYTSSLRVADELGARSVAFPLISAGAYGWPHEDAVVQAFAALCGADTEVEHVRLVLFTPELAALARAVLAGDDTGDGTGA